MVLPNAAGGAVCAAWDLKYWSGVEALVKETMAPPVAAKVYPTRKKKPHRGFGLGPLGSETEGSDEF